MKLVKLIANESINLLLSLGRGKDIFLYSLFESKLLFWGKDIDIQVFDELQAHLLFMKIIGTESFMGISFLFHINV